MKSLFCFRDRPLDVMCVCMCVLEGMDVFFCGAQQLRTYSVEPNNLSIPEHGGVKSCAGQKMMCLKGLHNHGNTICVWISNYISWICISLNLTITGNSGESNGKRSINRQTKRNAKLPPTGEKNTQKDPVGGYEAMDANCHQAALHRSPQLSCEW